MNRPVSDKAGMGLPCAAPCPKCGATDILRRFRANGERWDMHKFGCGSTKYANADGYYRTAHRDHIEHHCRVCQYDWQTPPLSKGRKRAA